MTALQVGTVLACVNIISGGLAALPLHVYERMEKKGRRAKRIACSHSIYDLLFTEPNPEMSAFDFKKMLQVHALLWGNAYAEIERNQGNQIVGLWPRNPARTRPVRSVTEIQLQGDTLPPGTLVYETSDGVHGSQISENDNPGDKLGQRRIILAEDMLHIKGLSLDGRLGQSTVYLARQMLGLMLATEKFGAKFFGNGAIPAGVLTLAGKLEDKALENLRRSWSEGYGGENRWKTAVLEQGVKYEKIGVNPNEGQFLETKRALRHEIAAIFQVPPHMIGEAEKTKSNVEQSSIEFVLYTLGPWIANLENELKRKMFPTQGRTAGRFFAKFDGRMLLYPDSQARSEFYRTGKQWGYLNSNDVRELEDMNPIDDEVIGDAYWLPVNMVPQVPGQPPVLPTTQKAESEPESQGKNPPEVEKKPPERAEAKSVAHYVKAFGPIFRDSFARLVSRTKRNEGDCYRVFLPVFETVGEAINNEAPKDGWVLDYLLALHKRSGDWKQDDVDRIARQEAPRAIRALMDLPVEVEGPFAMRHGTTEFNALGKYREWTDVDLDEAGKETVRQAAEKLKQYGIKRILATPLKRGKSTVEIVLSIIGNVPVTYSEELNTWKHGYGGKTHEEAEDKVKYYIAHPDETPPNGEKLTDFLERNQKAFDSAVDENAISGPLLLVTSGSNIGAWNQSKEKVGQELAGRSKIGPGGFGVIRDGKVVVLFEGDQHLSGNKAT